MTLHEAIRRGIGYNDQMLITRLKREYELDLLALKEKKKRIEFLEQRSELGKLYESMLEVEA